MYPSGDKYFQKDFLHSSLPNILIVTNFILFFCCSWLSSQKTHSVATQRWYLPRYYFIEQSCILFCVLLCSPSFLVTKCLASSSYFLYLWLVGTFISLYCDGLHAYCTPFLHALSYSECLQCTSFVWFFFENKRAFELSLWNFSKVYFKEAHNSHCLSSWVKITDRWSKGLEKSILRISGCILYICVRIRFRKVKYEKLGISVRLDGTNGW